MGARLPSSFTTTILTTLPDATERVVCITPPINPIFDSTAVMLWWWFNLVAGASVVAIQVRLYRGINNSFPRLNTNVTGLTTVATNTVYSGGCYVDVPGTVAGQQYCMTLSPSGATGATTLNDLAMLAIVL